MYELSVTQGVVKLYDINSGQKNEIPIKPDGPSQGLLRLIGKADQYQRPYLKFPLSVGQKWTYQYEGRFPGSKFYSRRSAEVNVVGIEQVTTPAGNFKTYKLIWSETWPITVSKGHQEHGGNTFTYFYSPETRSVVRSSNVAVNSPGTVETELIKFMPGN